MNLLYANPLALVFNYLAQFLYGTPLSQLQSTFSDEDKKWADVGEPKGTGPEVYDFIIVGGGSSGCVVASRLSEENYTVLLLEAGGNPFPLTSVPTFPLVNLGNENIDWKDKTVPQAKSCLGLKDNGVIWNRGKALGGGSLLNFMVYMRGNPKDYDNWAKLTGDEDWNYENLLPYFQKMESYNGQFSDDKLHGSDGPLNVAQQPFAPLVEEWLKAGQELGYKIKDPNGRQKDSIFPFETTTKEGTRYSTHRAYLYPVLDRKNLKVRIYSTATKIQLNSDNRATGVTYDDKSEKSHYATATREVIVTSGTLGSPHLLMLSGIGPKRHLESVGITPKVDLPGVGQNLQDHQLIWFGPFTFDHAKVTTPIPDSDENALHKFIFNGTGPFSGTGIGGGALSQSSVSPGWPDLYYTLLTLKITPMMGGFFESVFDFKPKYLQKYFASEHGKLVFFNILAIGLPKSRGEVKLKSKNPKDRLQIDPKYFDHPDDEIAAIEGMRLALDIVTKSTTMQKIGARLTSSLLPGCESFKNTSSDDYLKCYYRHWTTTMWHYSCTCKMGKGREDNSVVDSNLRVIGTKGLRVMDASVMPQVTNTNTNVPTIVIAEKGSDLIKNFWADACN